MEHLPEYRLRFHSHFFFFPLFGRKRGRRRKKTLPVLFLKALNLLWSLQLCCFADFLSLSPGRAKLWGHEGPFQYGVVECCGWMAYHIIEYHIWSTLCARQHKNVVFVVFFFSYFCGAMGKQQDLSSFHLIAALRDSAKKHLLKLCFI